MLGEVDLTHSTGADHPLNDVTSEDVTVVERHVPKPTNRHGRAANSAGEEPFPSMKQRVTDSTGRIE
jgi:hypothetical protein